jgi:glycosyltransferase involved in cell wall biosynthesis
MKVTLLVMALNEIEGMKTIMPSIDRGWCDQILVVDGGSTDGTADWAREQGYDVYVQRRSGIRHGYLESFPLVRGEVVVTFSPDGNCPPEAIPLLIAHLREGCDLVVASRYLGSAVSEDDNVVTAFGNWLFTRTVNLLHGGRYTDAMTIYRGFRRGVIAELNLDKEDSYAFVERLFSTVISWEPLMSVRAARHRLRVAEIPVDEPARIGGRSKLQLWRWGAAYYWQFWHELFRTTSPRAERHQFGALLVVAWSCLVLGLYGWNSSGYVADRLGRYWTYFQALL